nr:hypothetical protein [Tanacetum cinerariifolium]
VASEVPNLRVLQNSLYDQFVPQKELSREQVYWLSASDIASQSSDPPKPVTLFVHTRPVNSEENGADDHVSDKIDNLSLADEVENAFAGIKKKKKLVMLPRMKKMQRAHDQNFHGKEVIEIINMGSF